LADWKDRWLDTVGRGRYAWANRFAPSWKPRPHFKHSALTRETYGRLTQARTGHAHIGEYYRDFHIPEDEACPCGETPQTRQHILLECPQYEEHRHYLRDDDGNIIPADLMGTKKGLEKLILFLSKTDAFARRPVD
jgi:hypothetical protein